MLKVLLLTISVGIASVHAANCITVDSNGKRIVVDCASLQSSNSEKVETERTRSSTLDSASYQKEMDARIQEKLRTMKQEDAQKVQATIDAAKNRSEQRKGEFLQQK